GKSRESTQSAGLFTALSVWTVARKRQLAAWRGGFMQQRRSFRLVISRYAFLILRVGRSFMDRILAIRLRDLLRLVGLI
ncbi:hypothetical protein, partial [Ralstonia pseudosolanacearum]|uniref:hypothetical protein n=1 Tax=Ralstonia pseudosolanacearum TaxID=1310165 RepID=UPI001E47C108